MEEKTTLQKISEQLEKKMTRAVVAAIENGVTCTITPEGGIRIDEVYLTPKYGTKYYGLVLGINAPEIEQLFNDDLMKRAEELRAELKEIEKQIKFK